MFFVCCKHELHFLASEASSCCDLPGELTSNGQKAVALVLPWKHLREYAKHWNKVQSGVYCRLCSWSSCEFPVTQTLHSIDSLVSLATTPVQNLCRTDQNLGCETFALYKALHKSHFTEFWQLREKILPSKVWQKILCFGIAETCCMQPARREKRSTSCFLFLWV